MIFPQMLLDLHAELIVDLFAGGGGASCGIEMALGRQVDVAINHDAAAVSLHQKNHPQTQHFVSDVFEVDPRAVTKGRRVGLLWASPDCTFHSKARGGKPIRSKTRRRRALAWVVKRWAGQVRPRVIMLENVEEFANWGPLVGPPDALRPCSRRRGRTFRRWVRDLERLGYAVEWRELRACDYGAPTIRKRLFLVARCDGQPIVWPEPTHGPGRPHPYRTAAECIDWTIPMCSIFATREEAKSWGKLHGQAAPVRPLAEATLRRIARGVMRYVVDNPRPFIVPNNTNNSPHPVEAPVPTVTGGGRNILCAPVIAGVGGRAGQSPERSADAPYQTVTAKGDAALIAPLLSPLTHQGARRAHPLGEPAPTVTGAQRGELALFAPYLTEHANGSQQRIFPADEPLRTQVADVKGGHFSVAAPFLVPRYGERDGQEPRTRSAEEPAPVVVPTGNGASLVAAHLASYHAEKRPGDVRGSGLDEPADTLDAKNFGGVVGSPLDAPKGTVTTIDHDSLVAASLAKLRGTSSDADPQQPLHAVSAQGLHHAVTAAHLSAFQTGEPNGGNGDPGAPLRTVTSIPKAGLVYAFLQAYYGTGNQQDPTTPLLTISTADRFGLVTVQVDGQPYVIADIAMRMLQPRELFNAQGFPKSYEIDRGADGRKLTKTEQVQMCGNSVCPDLAAALAGSNVPDMVVRVAPAVSTRRSPAPRRRRHAPAPASPELSPTC